MWNHKPWSRPPETRRNYVVKAAKNKQMATLEIPFPGHFPVHFPPRQKRQSDSQTDRQTVASLVEWSVGSFKTRWWGGIIFQKRIGIAALEGVSYRGPIWNGSGPEQKHMQTRFSGPSGPSWPKSDITYLQAYRMTAPSGIQKGNLCVG